MVRCFAFCLLLVGLLSPSAAHNKSLSFSDWFWDGRDLHVSFTAPARDVTLLPEVLTSQGLAQALSLHVEKHMRLQQANSRCRLTRETNRKTPKTVKIRAAISAHLIGGVGNSSSR